MSTVQSAAEQVLNDLGQDSNHGRGLYHGELIAAKVEIGADSGTVVRTPNSSFSETSVRGPSVARVEKQGRYEASADATRVTRLLTERDKTTRARTNEQNSLHGSLFHEHTFTEENAEKVGAIVAKRAIADIQERAAISDSKPVPTKRMEYPTQPTLPPHVLAVQPKGPDPVSHIE